MSTEARRLGLTLAALAALLLLVAAGALLVGSAPVSPRAILSVLAGETGEGIAAVVVLNLRLPRILVAALAGGTLAVAGVAFQALTRNPLADPAILGVASGAAFGVVVAQLFGVGSSLVAALGLSAFAFAGALVAAGAVYAIAAIDGRLPIQTLLLTGVIVGLFFSSAITVVISVVDFNRLGGVIHWLLGNLSPIPAGSLAVFGGLSAVGVWMVLGRARQLNLLALGEESALQLGVETERLKRRIFLGASLLTSCVVAFTGPIGFVGLIVPHLLRGLVGPDNRLLIPAAVLGGAAFLLVADTLARTLVAPAELSVGVVTAFCGAPFFVYMLRSRYRGIP